MKRRPWRCRVVLSAIALVIIFPARPASATSATKTVQVIAIELYTLRAPAVVGLDRSTMALELQQ